MNAEAKKQKKGNYGVILNIPVIIKEKEIFERKKTIEIFKAKRSSYGDAKNQVLSGAQAEEVTGQRLADKLSSKRTSNRDEKVGRLFINELWSEKFHKQVLKESKIRDIIDRIQKLHRRNLDHLIGDLELANKNLAINNEHSPIVTSDQNLVNASEKRRRRRLHRRGAEDEEDDDYEEDGEFADEPRSNLRSGSKNRQSLVLENLRAITHKRQSSCLDAVQKNFIRNILMGGAGKNTATEPPENAKYLPAVNSAKNLHSPLMRRALSPKQPALLAAEPQAVPERVPSQSKIWAMTEAEEQEPAHEPPQHPRELLHPSSPQQAQKHLAMLLQPQRARKPVVKVKQSQLNLLRSNISSIIGSCENFPKITSPKHPLADQYLKNVPGLASPKAKRGNNSTDSIFQFIRANRQYQSRLPAAQQEPGAYQQPQPV